MDLRDKEIKCPCGYREYMEEHNCEKTDCDKCCPLALQEIINRQQAENQNLKGHLEQLKSRYDNAKAEIERLTIEYKNSKLLNNWSSNFIKEQKDTIDKQEAEIERLNRLVVKERDRKKIISEIWTRIKKYSFEDTRLKEGGGLERVNIVFRDDVNKCLRDFLIEWVGDDK